MDLGDATRIHVGDVLTSRYTSVPLRPLRVKAVWWNDAKTVARVQLTGVSDRDPHAWLDPQAFDFPPDKHRWCTSCREWESRETRHARHPHEDHLRRARHAWP